jgi:hypothetical protein
VLDTEFKYAKLRNDIRDGASVGHGPLGHRVVRAALVDVDRELAAKGVAAPLVAFGFSFSILFREGVEAVLLIAILLGSLAAGSAVELQAPARDRRRRRARRDRGLVRPGDPRHRRRAAEPRAARGGDRR